MQICPLLRTEMLVAGTVVVREGDVARNLFFLIDGKVRPRMRAGNPAATPAATPVRPWAESGADSMFAQ